MTKTALLSFVGILASCAAQPPEEDSCVSNKILTAVQTTTRTPCVADGPDALRCGNFAVALEPGMATIYRDVNRSASSRWCVVDCAACDEACQVQCTER